MIASVSTRCLQPGGASQTLTCALPNGSSLKSVMVPNLGGVTGHGSAPLGRWCFLHVGSEQPGTRSEVLRALYHLTPTELRIVHLLAASQDVNHRTDHGDQ